MLVDGDNIFPDVPDSLASAASFNEVPDFRSTKYGADNDCPEDCLTVAMLGDTDPFWGLVASPHAGSSGDAGHWGHTPPHLAANESLGGF